ncbi:unnamed protein product [Lactuca saligna]|uniref:Uncharacterized protein n=1 Tax=Lactuca saligna TaxID=75948 RepID=A0AA35Y8W3_LACSI|nr:unnamed protein product [Lactuca saligna]
MVFGAIVDRIVDPVPDSSAEQRTVVDFLSENYMKWFDPEEVVLGMAAKNRSLSSLSEWLNSDPIDPESTNLDSFLEIPPSSEFHDCPLVSYVEMKLDETNLLKRDINVSGPHPVVEASPMEPSIQPLVEGITQNLVPIVVVFPHNLFGSGFSYFQLVTKKSTTLVTEPVIPEARASNGDTLNVLVIEPDATTTDLSPDVVLMMSPMNLIPSFGKAAQNAYTGYPLCFTSSIPSILCCDQYTEESRVSLRN